MKDIMYLINSLINEFELRFSYFRDTLDEIKLFAVSFETDTTKAPEIFHQTTGNERFTNELSERKLNDEK